MNAREILSAGAVVPVIAVDDIHSAVDMAHALVAGGIPTLEITLRTRHGIEAVKLIKREVKGAIVGAGTVTDATALQAVADAGAEFAISPGLNAVFAQAAAQSPIPVIPGIATAGELMLASEYGMDTLKLFPAEAVGGISLLQALYGPFPHVKFCPTGGITPETAPDYLKLPNVLCVGGSWLTPKHLLAARDWDGITQLAKQAAALKKHTAC
ncbi:bifunctional 4-hydroxy-2-oxoglutarate aldolase/2-dehydro-3-deoxy-phosphogluconate aldolase [Neisseria leonii]|uniref:bifunctional 4-hydroxy-2-oxoglutarate aldolase/2-dehydro-3-deoxy-phosphogluconate aldolase n=1 Tax=Neisseria leonii TaxID=2995413 RepID=UPI00237AC30F|nr:bifunctional 4-hydroxy-2-oxoglutarate aldolase/2-dehydro-3-deoxy-phosphogluconate aldolase [Neisseria sp. 3986]MDD9325350.1 bifunctional 4-hydroxy-2-oxoglutarate aldolase/2-dehydro-3-deoxy-phosphogluconate aldolase [Neisseria sp. 3986]